MKKITLLSLFLLLCGMMGVKAQVVPQISTGETVYEYNIQFGSGQWTQVNGTGTNIKFNTNKTDLAKFKLVETTVDGYVGTDKLVKLIPTNKSGFEFPVSPNATNDDLAVFYRNADVTGNLDVWVLFDNGDGRYRLKAYTNENRSFTAWSNGNVGVWAYNANNGAGFVRFYPANANALGADITSGYYKIRNVRQATMYLRNEYANNNETYKGTAGAKNNYIWKVDINGLDFTITNGQGTPVKIGSNTWPTMEAVARTAANTYVFDNYIHCLNNTDDEVITTYATGLSEDQGNQWVFEVAEGTAYTVVLTGEKPEEATVTRTVGDVTETAFEGGFFMASGEALDGTLSATHIEGYTAGTPVVDEAAKTVTVNYTHNLTEYVNALTEANNNAKALLAKSGVGYPKADDEKRLALEILTEEIETALQTPPSLDYAEAEALEAAVEAYKSSTNVNMPKDGKAYTITSVNINGVQRYMNYTEGTGYGLVDRTDDPLPMTAVLICRDLGGDKYAFVNNDGKYFVWRGNGVGNNDHKGYLDAYDATNESSNTVLTVEKITVGGNVTGTQDALFGYMAMKGNRNNGNTPNYFVIKTAGGYDHADQKFFNSGFSSALLIEEVTYPNTPALKNIQSVNMAVGTFSAPFPTVVPAEVKAYYVAADAINSTTAKLTRIPEGKAIPANQGVILAAAKDAESALMVPATSETQSDLTGNLLKPSGDGFAKGAYTDTNSTVYVLSGHENKVAFYLAGANTSLGANKAYLEITGGAAAPSLVMNFGGETTGIESIVTESADKAVYDLSGRRIQNPTKGLYIIGGKKVYIK